MFGDSVVIERQLSGDGPPASLRGYNAKLHSERTSLYTGDDNKVQQQFAPEVDVNTIMRRHGITRSLPLGPASGVYGDFTDIHDYDSAVERIEGARERFMKLPAEVRERFKNDPGVLIERARQMEPDAFEAMFVGNPVPEPPAAAP